MDQNVVHSVTIKTEPGIEEKNISLVDFPFICRICLGRGELRLFQEEQCLWVLFLNLTKIDVHSTVDFPKNICMECITKLEDISSFIDIARNTDLDFVKNVSFIKVEDQMLPNPEEVGEYNNESTRYCCACFSPSNLSSFKEKTTLLQLFQEITMIDVGGNTNIWHKTSICSQCTNELRKVSHFKNLSITNSRFLERLAITDTKKELLSTNGDENLESVVERYVPKVECTVKFTASDIKERISEEGSYYINSESNTETKVNKPLPTSIDIKQEIIDSDTEASMDQTIDKHSSKDVLKETEEKPFRCEYCGKDFSRKYNMESHLLTHSGEKPFKCDYCDKHFTIKSNLKRHSLTHTGGTPLKCDYCHKGFTQKSYLNTHLLTHTGEKPFKCDHCDKHFNLNCNLKRHLLSHTGEKPFKCCHCGKAFALKQNLNSHLLTHNHSPTQIGEKFKCNHCDKYFNYKCFLKRHLLTHTGEKPFECCRCGKGFALKHHLNSHRISHNHLPTQT